MTIARTFTKPEGRSLVSGIRVINLVRSNPTRSKITRSVPDRRAWTGASLCALVGVSVDDSQS